MTKEVQITRRVQFAAAHRLHNPDLSPEVNKSLYGKCNHVNGHGHNYVVEVSLLGPVDETTGMVYNLADLKKDMDEAIMKPCDHKNLDKDIEFFAKVPSTTENFAIYIFEQMAKVLKDPSLLHEVRIHETENNVVSYKGKSC